MSDMSWGTRCMLYFYSGKNILGSLLALCGLGLFFAGIIADWWLPIVLGLYGVGYLVVPSNVHLQIEVQQELTQASLLQSVEDLISSGKRKLPREALERLQSIRDTVQTVAPRLFETGMAFDQAASLVNAVTRDLPVTVDNYLQLPPVFAAMHVVENGKTCKQLLLDQLTLLDGQLKQIADNVFKEDAQALLVNGKFLEEKFHQLKFVG